MDCKLKRRRFRFGLRAVFVACTLVAMVAAWFAWNIRVIERRKAALKGLISTSQVGGLALPQNAVLQGHENLQSKIDYSLDGIAPTQYTRYEPIVSSSTSTLRRWLGDYDRWLIACRPDSDVDLIRNRFPEALILMPLTHKK